MVVSFCLEVTYLKEPLQCATCSFRLLVASPKTITASLGTEVTIPHVELRLRRRISMCHGILFSPAHPMSVVSVLVGWKPGVDLGRPKSAQGKVNVHWAWSLEFLSWLALWSWARTYPSWSQCPSLWKNPLGVFEICNKTLFWVSK